MVDEHVYSVAGSKATPANPIDLASAGLRERSDLQEWVLAQPEILGPGVKIISFEFDRWESNGGERHLNRLDVLGLDTDGRLVLVELKRDRAPDSIQLQAINYAALASRFTADDVVASYLKHRRRTMPETAEETARDELSDHAGELDPEVLRQPRIVLVAGSFSPVTTATVVWLVDQGLDITLQRVQAYQLGSGEVIVTVSQLFPVQEVEDFMVSPMRAEARAVRERRAGGREKSTVLKLVETGALPTGTALTLVPTTELTAEARAQIVDWIAEDPRRGQATWTNDRAKPLVWAGDGKAYRPTPIVRTVVNESTGIDRGFAGPRWWQTADGRTLPEIAGAVSLAFDWSVLHELLMRVPGGRWVTYGDLAAIIGTAAQPLGGHVATCRSCTNAHRILGSDGTPSASFAWSDSERVDSQRGVLEAEGVTFVNGRAEPRQRMTSAELAHELGVAGF